MIDITNTEAVTRTKAERLGVALPDFTMAQCPALFTSWADRVAQADLLRARGKLTDADLDECNRQIGVPASRSCRSNVPLLSPRVFAAPSWLASFAADPMDGIRVAVERFAGASS